MAELLKTDRIWVKNIQTGNKTTIFYSRANDIQYLRRNNLVVVDERLTGEKAVAPPVKTTAEAEVKKLQAEMAVDKVEGIEFVETPKAVDFESMDVKELKAEADKRGITYAKTAGKAKMLELLK
jgi:hypothetical protein